MHLSPSDPDVATLYRKINQKRLDLQPNFQRGEVWGKSKKQRLIDSILRGWHIPPIHVIQVPLSDRQEVLDGQQRLAAIRDFIEGEYAINGNQDPLENYIIELDGLHWNELPNTVKSKIEDFTIRVLTITDYKPGEPGELFYRLNQPTNLTSAEQRNAYFGEARQQVKDLAEKMINIGFSRDLIGFSNSRMAYDDVIAKFLLTLEIGTLTKKITANTVTSRYRESTGFSKILEDSTANCLRQLHMCLIKRGMNTKLNKATLSSWLIFIYNADNIVGNIDLICEYFRRFESLRECGEKLDDPHAIPKGIKSSFIIKLLQIYQDRASSRVADTSSVVLRDMILWGIFAAFNPYLAERHSRLNELFQRINYLNSEIDRSFREHSLWSVAKDLNWGAGL